MGKLRDYFAARTAEQVKADKDKEEADERMRKIKTRIDTEKQLKYEQSHQPSHFQEDVSKVTKSIVSGAKKAITITAPVVKKVAVETAKSVKEAAKSAAPVVERMGKGAAETEFYEPERKRQQQAREAPPPKPQRQKPFVDNTAPAPRIGKDYDPDRFVGERPSKPKNDDDEFGVSGFSTVRRPKQEKETPRKLMKQPEGADKYFVNVHKKRVPPKEEKKKGGSSGFGLGF